MRSLLPIILSLLLLALRSACAQPADDFFNSGAQFYISNNIANAQQAVEGGLKLYPNDVKLKKLEELLKQQQQQQQQQQNQNQQQQNQQNQQQQSQQNQQNQQNQQPNQKPQDQQDKQDKQNQEKNQQQQEQQQQNQATAAREMSPEEAKRLLDAQKGDEQFLQLKPKSSPESPNKPIKDW